MIWGCVRSIHSCISMAQTIMILVLIGSLALVALGAFLDESATDVSSSRERLDLDLGDGEEGGSAVA